MKLFHGLHLFAATLLLLLALCARSQAASLEDALAALPDCASACTLQSVQASSCGLTNLTCICTDTQLNLALNTCVQQNCTVKESLTAKNVSTSTCGAPIRDDTRIVSIVGVAGGALALFCVLLRAVSRLPCAGGQFELGWDDYVIFFSCVPMVALTVFSVVLADAGLGRDMWTLPFDQITRILHVYFIDEFLYLSSLAITKISILCFYLRIFPEKQFRRVVHVLIGLCVIYIFVENIITAFQCRPISYAWKKWDNEHEGHCINVNAHGYQTAVWNILLDLLVIGAPLRQLMKLNLTVKKRIGIMVMFSVGFFVTIISILRLKWMVQFANSENVSWDYTPIGYWSTIEVHLGIVCACLPTIRALLLRIFPSLADKTRLAMSSRSRNGGAGGGGGPPTNTAASNISMVQQISVTISARPPKDDVQHFIPLEDLESVSGASSDGGEVGRGRKAVGVKAFIGSGKGGR